MTETPVHKLKKPAQTDYYDVDVFNANMDTIDAALGTSDIDCGTFDALTPVAAHNESPKAHATMTVDGNAVVQASGGELAAHETDPLAHQNIILDGNIN